MARKLRIESEGGISHVISRVNYLTELNVPDYENEH